MGGSANKVHYKMPFEKGWVPSIFKSRSLQNDCPNFIKEGNPGITKCQPQPLEVNFYDFEKSIKQIIKIHQNNWIYIYKYIKKKGAASSSGFSLATERDLSHRRGPVLDLANMFTNEAVFIKTLVRKILAMFLYVFAFQIVLNFTGALRGRRVYKKHTSRAVFTKCLRQKKHCGTIVYNRVFWETTWKNPMPETFWRKP